MDNIEIWNAFLASNGTEAVAYSMITDEDKPAFRRLLRRTALYRAFALQYQMEQLAYQLIRNNNER